jgi:cellulose 1,4-beta-cellobiosidase
VTNVANYNAFVATTCPSYTQGNAVCDEKSYINSFAPQLASAGFDAHFIVDTGKSYNATRVAHPLTRFFIGRNGKQPTGQLAWGDWCNVIGTGFGVRPTTDTGDKLVDAFVWVKPGGESDGTSDTSAKRYDAKCGLEDALKPAPEAGTWFQVCSQDNAIQSCAVLTRRHRPILNSFFGTPTPRSRRGQRITGWFGWILSL